MPCPQFRGLAAESAIYCVRGVATLWQRYRLSIRYLFRRHTTEAALTIPRATVRTCHPRTGFAFDVRVKIPQSLALGTRTRNKLCHPWLWLIVF